MWREIQAFYARRPVAGRVRSWITDDPDPPFRKLPSTSIVGPSTLEERGVALDTRVLAVVYDERITGGSVDGESRASGGVGWTWSWWREAGNPTLAAAIGSRLEVDVADATIERFPDGESHVVVRRAVRGDDVYIVQPTGPPVDEHLVELLLLADACRRGGAGRITLGHPLLRLRTPGPPSRCR